MFFWLSVTHWHAKSASFICAVMRALVHCTRLVTDAACELTLVVGIRSLEDFDFVLNKGKGEMKSGVFDAIDITAHQYNYLPRNSGGLR